jgi:hypothetical protein
MNDSDVISGLTRLLPMTRREQRGNSDYIASRGRVVGRPALITSVMIQGRVRWLWYSCGVVARRDGREQGLLIQQCRIPRSDGFAHSVCYAMICTTRVSTSQQGKMCPTA